MPATGRQPVELDLPEELRQRLRRLERRSPWEVGLAATLGTTLLGILVSALFRPGEFQVNLRTPWTIFFVALALLLLLAWLVLDRAKRARIYQLQMVAEMLHRGLQTEQALRDALTGVYNRAALQEFAERSFKRAERFGEPLAVVVLDLNYFHELNNKFGHIAGDLALTEFAHVLQSSTRGSDVVARYGGDEFVMLLAETPRTGAEVVIRRVEDRVRARNARLSEGQVPLSFTAGAAAFQKGRDFAAVFGEADADLLRRKAERPGAAVRAGRD